MSCSALRKRTLAVSVLDKELATVLLVIATLVGTAFLPEDARAANRTEGDRRQYADRLSQTRVAYFRVITSNDHSADAQAHAALAELERAYPGDPIAKAYHGSLELLDAAHNWASWNGAWNLHKQASEGLTLLDAAVSEAPDEPEARFIRAATSWHLPGFYHRRAQCEADFALLAQSAQRDASEGRLPPELAAAAYNYWGQILVARNDLAGARAAFATGVKIAPQSPGGIDAGKRLSAIK